MHPNAKAPCEAHSSAMTQAICASRPETIHVTDEEEARRYRWREHCLRMAEATHAIADWCEEPEMMGAYLALGARWIRMADEDPPPMQHRNS